MRLAPSRAPGGCDDAAACAGESATFEAAGFEARALQHEIDHCAGLLFVDRVAGAYAVFAGQTYL